MTFMEMLTMTDEDIIKGMESLKRKLREAPDIDSSTEVTFEETRCLDMAIQWLKKIQAQSKQAVDVEDNETR